MPLQLLQSVPSTMDIARDNLLAGRVRFEVSGRPIPTGVRAEEQTAGRGQRGREWFARPGECLCATYYFKWGMNAPEVAGQLAFLAGVAVVDMLVEGNRKKEKEKRRRGEEEKLEYSQTTIHDPRCIQPLALHAPSTIGLKWPNDILLNRRKVGGILIELVETPEQEWIALIGVGINVLVREFPAELDASATSLWREKLEVEAVGALAEAIGASLERCAHIWLEKGFETILARWRAYDVTPGCVFETLLEGQTVQGTAEGIEVDGALRLRLSDNRVLRVLSASSLREKPAL